MCHILCAALQRATRNGLVTFPNNAVLGDNKVVDPNEGFSITKNISCM